MKRTLYAVIAGLSLGLLAITAPTEAAAQRRAAPPSQTEVNANVRELVAINRLSCNVDAARFIGRNNDGRTLYEVACVGAPGFLLLDTEPAQVVDCVANNGSVAARRAENPDGDPGAECTLERNLNLAASVAPLAQQAGVTCQVDDVRWVGSTTEGATRYEIGCVGGDGYWFDATREGVASNVMPCLQVVAAGGQCTLTDPATQAAWVAALAAPSGRACQATAARYVGARTRTNAETDDSARYYEVGCAEGTGFMIRTATDNTFQAVIECAAATGIAGGCTLSDTAAVAASANADYQRRLTDAGFACNLVEAGTPRQETDGDRRQVVEFKCSDRPWGLVAFLPTSAGSPEQIDCLTADVRIGGCTLTLRADLIEELSLLMGQRSNSPCSVEEFRFAGRLGEADGAEFVGDVVELKCSQGNGYIAVVSDDRSAISTAQSCTTSAQRGGTRCQL